MKADQTYIVLDATDWSGLHQQIKAAISDAWHRQAGYWQPHTISLHLATRLMPAANDDAQRNLHLPQLVAWLRHQGQAISVRGDPDLQQHRLYLNQPKKIIESN